MWYYSKIEEEIGDLILILKNCKNEVGSVRAFRS